MKSNADLIAATVRLRVEDAQGHSCARERSSIAATAKR